jgi:hypothetical protein
MELESEESVVGRFPNHSQEKSIYILSIDWVLDL